MQVNYDELSDTLYVSFKPGKDATGIELNDHITESVPIASLQKIPAIAA
jgi:uncharacterized protein YuzE